MRVLKKHKGPLPFIPKRTKGWETRLFDTLTELNEQPLTWGKTDCITRVANVALTMTGVDPMRDFRGAFSTEAEAAKLLVARGCKDVGDLLAQAFTEVSPSLARRGDVGIVPGPDGLPSAVVFEGAEVSGAGQARTSRLRVTRAFIVG